jgi:hypothetical protein
LSLATGASLAEQFVQRRDNDSHNYQVPSGLAARFDQLLEDICTAGLYTDAWYEANDILNDEFGGYLTN